ncbi:membrane protein [Alkalihalobacillus pseudalcaliphilus]|nr:membrane protein [Alkalihalobacillus pseudalcaliphilus]
MLQRFSLEALIVGFIGGYIFALFQLPLPWVLGSLSAITIFQAFTKRKIVFQPTYKDIGLVTLGAYFGLYFTISTFTIVTPFIIPYIIATSILILVSIIMSTLVTKWIPIDQVTSVFSSIPGGLTEMAVASEALHAKSAYVVIFQTVRLVSVLFIVPPLIITIFSPADTLASSPTIGSLESLSLDWTYTLYLIPIIGGYLLRNIIPAGIVVGSMVITILIHLFMLPLPTIPDVILLIAQVFIGISLGKSIHIPDLKAGGKYGFIYFIITLLLIATSFVLAYFFSLLTGVDIKTSLLSLAPGGLIEMVLTASQVGADPALVSAFQLTRILVIILCVPGALKWYFHYKSSKN